MSDNDFCNFSYPVLQFIEWATFTDNYVIMPLYMIVGFFGNFALLAVFYKQWKHDDAYAYQVTLTLSKIMEILNFLLFYLSYKWCAAIETESGCPWFVSNYVLMFFSAHVVIPFVNGLILISLLLSVAMSADRVFALGQPFLYKTINHKRHYRLAVLLCIGIGILSSAFEVGRFQVKLASGNETEYLVRYNGPYMVSPAAVTFWGLRQAVRVLAVLTLIALNTAMVVVFRKNNRKVGQMARSMYQTEAERKGAERNLLFLTAYQSILIVISQGPLSALAIASAVSPVFKRCYTRMMSPFCDMALEMTDTLDFFVLLAINKRIRKIVWNAMKFT